MGPRETNGPGCGAQMQSTQLSYHLILHHCFSNPDCIWKIHAHLYVYFLIYCLSSPLEYIIQESGDLCVTLRTAALEPSGTQQALRSAGSSRGWMINAVGASWPDCAGLL